MKLGGKFLCWCGEKLPPLFKVPRIARANGLHHAPATGRDASTKENEMDRRVPLPEMLAPLEEAGARPENPT